MEKQGDLCSLAWGRALELLCFSFAAKHCLSIGQIWSCKVTLQSSRLIAKPCLKEVFFWCYKVIYVSVKRRTSVFCWDGWSWNLAEGEKKNAAFPHTGRLLLHPVTLHLFCFSEVWHWDQGAFKPLTTNPSWAYFSRAGSWWCSIYHGPSAPAHKDT